MYITVSDIDRILIEFFMVGLGDYSFKEDMAELNV